LNCRYKGSSLLNLLILGLCFFPITMCFEDTFLMLFEPPISVALSIHLVILTIAFSMLQSP
jgi:hypothetical protein